MRPRPRPSDIPRSRTDADEDASIAETAAKVSEMALNGKIVEVEGEGEATMGTAGGDGGRDEEEADTTGQSAKAKPMISKAELRNRKRGSSSSASSAGHRRDKTEFKIPKMMSELIAELTAAAVVGGGGGGASAGASDADSWDLIALENRLRVFQRANGNGERKPGAVSIIYITVELAHVRLVES